MRISIRGFGARSAFGIRGIKLIVDGIPETTPDGQSQLDNLPLGLISNIEILRGPNANLYGNSSGGVIGINTLTNPNDKFYRTSGIFGAYQYQSIQRTIEPTSKRTSTIKSIIDNNKDEKVNTLLKE